MGMPMSIIAGAGGGMTGYLEKILYKQLLRAQFDRNITEFDDFHIAILSIISTINSAVPGNRYEVPDETDIQEFFQEWKSEESEAEKERIFGEFVEEKVKISRGSRALAVTGILAGPVAMAVRRKGEEKLPPQLKLLKAVPDAVFVPFFTLLALTSVKLGRRIFH